VEDDPVAVDEAAKLLTRQAEENLPETFWYSVKRRALGPPLVNDQLKQERLSRPLALGVLSCDGISSAAYGTEEILVELVPCRPCWRRRRTSCSGTPRPAGCCSSWSRPVVLRGPVGTRDGGTVMINPACELLE
jgi:hypothetical protein